MEIALFDGSGGVNVCEANLTLSKAKNIAPPEKILKFNKREHQGAPLPSLYEFVRVCVAVKNIKSLARFFFSHKIGQKHSRLGRERVARFRYSLFFSISTSASSSTGRAGVEIKKKTPLRSFARCDERQRLCLLKPQTFEKV